jgi:ABC-type transport system involved in cytochrome bd biosynthesis fused ATPase/permease subunit
MQISAQLADGRPGLESMRLAAGPGALLPAGCTVLLLDEPTANLDALTEQRLLTTLPSLINGRSVLWITHRLVGMEMADEIVVLDAGRIVQRGTHHSLIHLPGLYQRLWNIQKRILLDLPGTSGPSPAF